MHVATTEHMGGATPGEEKAEEEEVVVEKMEGGEAVEELSSWIKPSGGVSVVFEMFLRPRHQELLDAFLKEAQAETPAEAMEDVEELETRLEAAGRSGFTTQHYGQLLLLARELGDVTALAGFPPRSDAEDSVKVAAREGYAAGLARARAEGSLDIAASLGPEVEAAACALPCESHFNVFESIFTGRDPNDRDALTNNFRRIFPAQCVADAICAATVLERLAAGDRVLVILGCGHTDYGFGVPQRVELGLQALKHRLQNEGTGMLEPYRGGTDLFEPKEAPAEVDFTEHAGLGAVRITSRCARLAASL
uniref:Haem-binding uptake Tiki superfamily ChaN domain-containing protein n=2 Tax=Phaeomonas parva TaxID=124430 RepID=A0A7S1XK25_9STRA|mmetsp:Transcript_1394/g.3540  ORF Transcript_1394/g.3540 Transcript_1394/m.3540 type:complete len:308 (+) Transcript_1394:555-1478(+)